MDFTDLKERAREAKLDYGEAESLVRYLNFQRERVGEAPIHEDYGNQFCQLLSENYSGLTFEYAGHRIIARVERGVRGSLVERIGFVSRKIPHLATTVGQHARQPDGGEQEREAAEETQQPRGQAFLPKRGLRPRGFAHR